MKRVGVIFCVALIITAMSGIFAYGETLELKDSYPRDKGTGFQIENTGVKLYFNQEVLSPSNKKINEKAIKVVDEKGKEKPVGIYYSSKEKGLMLVLIKGTLDVKTEYRLTVDKSFTATSGDTLTKPISISFSTRDTGRDMKVNMGIMALMFGGIFFVSSRNMKKQMAKDDAEKQKDSKVNPYKLAKETGKSVEEIVAKDKKEKAKREKAQAKRQQKGGKSNASQDEPAEEYKDYRINHYKVKGPRPISESGSQYKTGRAAAAKQAEAKKVSKGTTRPKGETGKMRKNKKK